jgi:hypothetical protein
MTLPVAQASRAEGAVGLAVDAVACTLEDAEVSPSRCASVAALAGGREGQLRAAEHGLVERLLESLAQRARTERLPPADRAAMLRWLDLGLAAGRELHEVRRAARGGALTRAQQDPARASDLDEIEGAAAQDTLGVRARAHLDAVRRLESEGSHEARALAVIFAAARVRVARGATDIVRDSAVESAIDVAIDVAGFGGIARSAREERATYPAQDGGAERGARAAGGGAEPSIDEAWARLVGRAAERCPRVDEPLRALCERSVR